MAKSTVYFTNLRTSFNESARQAALADEKAGIGNIDFDRKYVAIKIHFGEPGNLAFCVRTTRRRWRTWLRSLAASPSLPIAIRFTSEDAECARPP